MYFYMATNKHGFLQVKGEAITIDGIECFTHEKEDNTFSVSLVKTGVAFVSGYYNRNDAIERAETILANQKYKQQLLDHINKTVRTAPSPSAEQAQEEVGTLSNMPINTVELHKMILNHLQNINFIHGTWYEFKGELNNRLVYCEVVQPNKGNIRVRKPNKFIGMNNFNQKVYRYEQYKFTNKKELVFECYLQDIKEEVVTYA